jgi:hypothetical protein
MTAPKICTDYSLSLPITNRAAFWRDSRW